MRTASTRWASWPFRRSGTRRAFPVDVTQTGNARRVPLLRKGQDAHLVEAVRMNGHVLGMEVKELVPELAQRADRVHLLQDKVRRVVVEAEVLGSDITEHPPPNDRGDGQVLPARPLIA